MPQGTRARVCVRLPSAAPLAAAPRGGRAMSMFGASASDAAFVAALGGAAPTPAPADAPPTPSKRGSGRAIVPALPLATVPPPPPEEPKTPPPGTAPPPLPPPLVAPSPAKTLSLVAAIGADPVFAPGDRVAIPQLAEGALCDAHAADALVPAGTVRFYGQVHFQPGVWVGVELDAPQGKNDGSVQGQRYFNCKPQYGIFIRPGRLTLVNVRTHPIANQARVPLRLASLTL